ncbi:hypothetical protein [Streptacidiphilus albus]|uniref:hypothetical protein n=1 Tax=Streptacidiphilus albus TaxID=105425 RepID=UPI00054B5561|nr:hypothetical protein [Streptacidiphilus albus]
MVYLMIAALMPVTKSKRSAVGALTDEVQWKSVRKHIRANLSRAMAARLPDQAPTRDQYQYAEAKLLAPAFEELEEEFRRSSFQQALEQGLFPEDAPRNWARPERRQLIVGDGTVPKAPSKAERTVTVDTTTGEIKLHRVYSAARVYYENGEEEKVAVRGTKWFFASARDDCYWRRVILSFAHVAGGAYEDEAAIAVRHFSRLKRDLPGCMGVVYDGAFRGVHRDALARLGLLVINKQHKSIRPRHLELLRPGRCRHDLWCDQGRVAERVIIDDGTSVLIPVPVTRLQHGAGASKSRWYHTLRVPCRYGPHEHRVQVGITSHSLDRKVVDPATGKPRKSDAELGFHRAEYLQQIPQLTLAHQTVYPYRSDSESVNSQFDLSLWNRRMISYGIERQKVFALAFAMSQNATSRRIHQEDGGRLWTPGQGHSARLTRDAA